jgi:hypothetical protein
MNLVAIAIWLLGMGCYVVSIFGLLPFMDPTGIPPNWLSVISFAPFCVFGLFTTRDASGLYNQYGYTPFHNPEHWTEKFNPDAN